MCNSREVTSFHRCAVVLCGKAINPVGPITPPAKKKKKSTCIFHMQYSVVSKKRSMHPIRIHFANLVSAKIKSKHMIVHTMIFVVRKRANVLVWTWFAHGKQWWRPWRPNILNTNHETTINFPLQATFDLIRSVFEASTA